MGMRFSCMGLWVIEIIQISCRGRGDLIYVNQCPLERGDILLTILVKIKVGSLR